LACPFQARLKATLAPVLPDMALCQTFLSGNAFSGKTGLGANLSEVEFKKFAPDGMMDISQFKAMCLEKNYEDVEEEEMEGAFVRLNTSGSGNITYNEYLVWWKTGVFDDNQRQVGLKFQSTEEREKVMKARCSFFQGTAGCEAMTQEQFRLKCYIAGYCLTDEELDEAFLSIDKDANGEVEFVEYLRWRLQDDRFGHLQSDDENSAYIHQIADFFRTYDTNLKGYLSVEQFAPLYESLLGAGRIQAPITEVVDELDVDQTGSVKLNDFVLWYSQADCCAEEEGEFDEARGGGA